MGYLFFDVEIHQQAKCFLLAKDLTFPAVYIFSSFKSWENAKVCTQQSASGLAVPYHYLIWQDTNAAHQRGSELQAKTIQSLYSYTPPLAESRRGRQTLC